MAASPPCTWASPIESPTVGADAEVFTRADVNRQTAWTKAQSPANVGRPRISAARAVELRSPTRDPESTRPCAREESFL
jgi:hypothetical protein